MTTHKKALMLAREYVLTHSIDAGEVFIAIEEALAGAECDQQPEQEPVAHSVVEPLRPDEYQCRVSVKWVGQPVAGPLYTTQPQRTWVGLSREDCYQVRERESDAFMYGVAWAEAKLKEKNT